MLTRGGVRALDRAAMEELGIPGLVLMENAAASIERECTRLLADRPDRRVLVLCGAGNNGGDGLAVARRLSVGGCSRVRVGLVVGEEKLVGDAGANLRMARGVGVEVARMGASEIAGEADAGSLLVVDALLGTGLDRPLEGAMAEAADAINELRGPGGVRGRESFVLSVDLPSGLDADTGEPLGGGACVVADLTVTLAALKPGLVRSGSRRWTGVVKVGAIGVPRWLIERMSHRVEEPDPAGGSDDER